MYIGKVIDGRGAKSTTNAQSTETDTPSTWWKLNARTSCKFHYLLFLYHCLQVQIWHHWIWQVLMLGHPFTQYLVIPPLAKSKDIQHFLWSCLNTGCLWIFFPFLHVAEFSSYSLFIFLFWICNQLHIDWIPVQIWWKVRGLMLNYREVWFYSFTESLKNTIWLGWGGVRAGKVNWNPKLVSSSLLHGTCISIPNYF